MNDTLKTILIALIILWLYHNYSKEGFDYRRYNVLEGYNNMVLTTEKGDLGSIAFPSGMVMIWTKGTNNIPSGWALCDGNNGTPDLRGKFILGVNPNSDKMEFRTVGRDGGSAKISVGQLPAHTHDIVGKGDDSGYCATGECGFYSTDRLSNDREVRASKSGGKLVVETEGRGEDYYPPFVTLAYIMKL
jgi:microcystin-dependent protein